MERVLEPELMLDANQAKAYAEADFEAPHNRVIELFKSSFPDWPGSGRVVDLGCGPGDISCRFAFAYPECLVDGIDGSEVMMAAGQKRINADGLAERVRLYKAKLPADELPETQYGAVISNSLLHHLHDPMVLWSGISHYAGPQAPIFVIDLLRPADIREARMLCERYAAGEPELLRQDFFNSLCAAFTPDEVKAQLYEAGLGYLEVEVVSDRHMMIRGYFKAY